MNVLDLFSGIGGFSLGLERAGMRTVAFCEIDRTCYPGINAHWPCIPIYPDVRWISRALLAADGIIADVVCGGFPCQDISDAGAKAGLDGERSGLWREFARVIGELRPEFAIVENVAALTYRGLLRVLGDLAALGYDAEWHCIPASAVGAPHRRDRVWIVAYPERRRLQGGIFGQIDPETIIVAPNLRTRFGTGFGATWPTEPDVPCLDDGIPSRLAEAISRWFGNAVVPTIPEIIGRAIMKQREYVSHGDRKC